MLYISERVWLESKTCFPIEIGLFSTLPATSLNFVVSLRCRENLKKCFIFQARLNL